MRYHFTPTRMAIKTNKQKRKYQVLFRMWRNWNHHTLLMGMAAFKKKKKIIYLFILAAPGLSCSTQDLCCGMRDL